MLGNGDDLKLAQRRFYERSITFKQFNDVDEDKIADIDILVEAYREKNKKSINQFHINPKSAEYYNLINYLLYNKELSFDEKVLFLIRYIDPECKLLELYLNTKQITSKEIKEEDNTYVKNEMIIEQEKQNLLFQGECRKIAGVYDPYIIKYESKLQKRLKNTLKFDIKKDYINYFFSTVVNDGMDLSISDFELEIIIRNAKIYKEKYGIPSLNDLAYQLSSQYEILGITSKKQAIIFMIYVIDENFRLFHIYDEYGKWEYISDEAKKEMGFFNKSLVLHEVRFDKDNHDDDSKLSTFK